MMADNLELAKKSLWCGEEVESRDLGINIVKSKGL